MDAASQLLSRQLGKPALHLVDPRRRRGREMHVIVGPPRQPGFDLRSFVGGVVIHDDMDVETFGNTRVDLL
jgi:hypothetical protein